MYTARLSLLHQLFGCILLGQKHSGNLYINERELNFCVQDTTTTFPRSVTALV